MRYLFSDFLAKFPPIPMPVTLGEETHHAFSTENEPLPLTMVESYIHPTDPEAGPDDEFTEYVPCFAIDNTDGFVALVWWKAGLLRYEYVLATFTLKGELIARRVIASTRVSGEKISRSVASIDEDWVIFIAEGEAAAAGDVFDPTTSRTYDLEIMSNGEIV